MKIIKPYIWSAVMFHMKQVTQQRYVFAAIIWKSTMENSMSFINTTDIYAGDQSSGLSGTLFIFFVYFFPFPAFASLMLCCFFIGNVRKNKHILPQFKCNYDKGIITLSDLTKTRDLVERPGCICDRCFHFVVVIPIVFLFLSSTLTTWYLYYIFEFHLWSSVCRLSY